MVPEEVLTDAIVATNSKQVSLEQQVIISTSAVLNSCQITHQEVCNPAKKHERIKLAVVPEHSTDEVSKQSEPSVDMETFCREKLNVRRKPFCIINSETFAALSRSFCSKYANVSVSS